MIFKILYVRLCVYSSIRPFVAVIANFRNSLNDLNVVYTIRFWQAFVNIFRDLFYYKCVTLNTTVVGSVLTPGNELKFINISNIY